MMVLDKVLKKEIILEDLEEAYKILKQAGEEVLPETENIHKDELQTIKNTIKFINDGK